MAGRKPERVYRCSNPDCNQIIGYMHYRIGSRKKAPESLCFNCLIEKSKREYRKSVIRSTKLFSVED